MIETMQKPASATLCKACGLCCTGHLFVNAEFKPSEIQTARALGMDVLQSDPERPAFHLPCPLWKGQCTIYTHPHKPSICSDFKCKLLREVEDGQRELDDALLVVQRTRQLIQELAAQIPVRRTNNFRQYLLEYLNQLEQAAMQTESDNAFRLKAGVLLVLFAQRFGVKGLFNAPEREKSAQE
jgi:hypothetical protein